MREDKRHRTDLTWHLDKKWAGSLIGSALSISAMYGRNLNPKIFTDITKPAKQSYGPNIGKVFVI